MPRCQKLYRVKAAQAEHNLPSSSGSPVEVSTRKTAKLLSSLERKCFNCNIIRESDSRSYNYDFSCATQRIRFLYVKMFSSRQHHCNSKAARRLEILLVGGHVIFVADVWIHQYCYRSYVNKPVTLRTPK